MHIAGNKQIILASASFRRKKLLEEAGLDFIVEPSCFEEDKIHFSEPGKYTIALAEAKSDVVAHKFPDAWIISADTIVVTDDKIIGKPKSKKDAKEIFTTLSGKVHRVYTGYSVALLSEKKKITGYEKTYVQFKELSQDEIYYYIENGDPFDKAGGYSLMGISAFFIKSIKGSYTNVLGIPVCEVIDILIREKIVTFPKRCQSIDISYP